MNEELVDAREEEPTTLYIKNTKSGGSESIDGGSNIRAEFLSSMSQEDDRNSYDALSNRMRGEEDRDMDTGLNEEGSLSAEPSMNPFAAFVDDSHPVERTEDEHINEARQEVEQVDIEEAEYLIADVDAQEAELPISDTFTFELSDDDADDEEEQEIENVSPSAQSLREEHRRSPIEEMKILLSKYTDTKRGEGEAPQADESIEPSIFSQDEQRKRPSLNLANFLPSDEASDPFLQVIQEGDDEETNTINKSEHNSIDDQSESLLPSLSTDARDHFAHEDPFAADILEMATPNDAFRKTSAGPFDNAILEPLLHKQKLSSFLYPSHNTDLVNLVSKSEDCHKNLEDEDEDELASSSSFDSQRENALEIDDGAPDTIFDGEVNPFDSELAETEVQDEDVELADAQTPSLEESSFLDSIKADIAAGLHLDASISEEDVKHSHAENAVDFLSNIVETRGMNNPSEEDSNPFADDVREDTLDNQAEVIEVENFGSHVSFSERSIAYKDGKEHVEFPKDTMPEELLRLDDVVIGCVTDYEAAVEELINDPFSGEVNGEVLEKFAESKGNNEDPFGCDTDDAASNVADDASIKSIGVGQSGEEDAFVNAAICVGFNSGEVDEEVMEDFEEHANVNESFPVESANDKELNSKDVLYSVDGEYTSEKKEFNVVEDPFDDEAISLRMAKSEGFQSVELKESGDDADASDKPVEERGNANKTEKSENNASQPQEQRATGKRFGNLRSVLTRRFQRKSRGVPADNVAEDQPLAVPEVSRLDISAAAEQVPAVIDEQIPVKEEEVKNAEKDLAILQPELVPHIAAFVDVDAVETDSFEGANVLAEEVRDDAFKADTATEIDVAEIVDQLSETRRPSSPFDKENEHHPSSFDNEADEAEDILKEPSNIEADLEYQESQEHLTKPENVELNSRNGDAQEMDDIYEGDLSFAEDDMIEERVDEDKVEKDSVPGHWPVEANVANDIDESETDSILDVVAIQGVGETIEHNSEIRNHIADSFDELFGADTEGEDEDSVSESNGLSSTDHSLDEVLNYENAEDEGTLTSSFEAEKYAHSDSFGDIMESSEGEDVSFGADTEGEDEHSVSEKNGLNSRDHSVDESLSYDNAADEEMPTNDFEAEKYTHLDSFGDVMESTREEERENEKFELTRSVSPNLKSSSSISTTSTVSYTTPKDKSGHKNSIEFEMMPDNMGQDFNDFTPQHPPRPRSHNAGHRLYAQGIEQERKKAIYMKRYNDEWNSSKNMILKTRGRSMSAPRSRIDSNGPSVYSRLYAIAKERDVIVKHELPRMSSTKAIASTPRVRSLSRGGQPAYERLYNLAKSQKMKVEERVKNMEAKRASSRGRSFGVLSLHERLYNLAQKKREIEEERLKVRKKEIEEQEKPKGLVLATRNYTPVRARSGTGSNSVHSRLYSLAKVQKSAMEIRQEISAVDELQSPHSTKTRTQRTSGLDRLYGPSLKKQQEGQQRRQMIEMKKKKKILPSGKISLDKAHGIYERGMMIKVNLEVKREDQGLLPYVSPLLNPLLVEGDGDGEYFSQCSPTGRSRSNSVASRAERSRPNSVASSRHGRSSSRARTPLISRNRGRSAMPSMPKTNATPMSEGSRLRARSRLRSSTPTSFSFRSPSPIPARPSTISVVSSSKLSSRLKGRSGTPLRADKRNSTKELLRKMEEDVGFYKKVKAALAEKDKKEAADSSDSSAQSRQRAHLDSSNHTSPSLPPQIPTTEKLYVSRTPDSPRGLKSDISNGTLQTGSIMTNSSNEHESIPQGRFLIRPRSVDYCD